jgi:hypothetical protein
MYLYPVLVLLFTSFVRLQMCPLHYVCITFVPVIPKYKQQAINTFKIQKLFVVLITGIT